MGVMLEGAVVTTAQHNKGEQVYENNRMWQVKLIKLHCLQLKVKS